MQIFIQNRTFNWLDKGWKKGFMHALDNFGRSGANLIEPNTDH